MPTENLFKAPDKVTYIPFTDADKSLWQHGMVKSVNEDNPSMVFVVFHCNGDWENYKSYTGQSTNVARLKQGWL